MPVSQAKPGGGLWESNLGVRLDAPVSREQEVVDMDVEKADKSTSGAAVRPGQTVPRGHGVQAGKIPDVLAAHPSHVLSSAAKASGSGHASGVHDALDVGATFEIGTVPLGQE